MINEQKVRLQGIGNIPIELNQKIEIGKDYKLSMTFTCKSKEEEDNEDGNSNMLFKLKLFTLDEFLEADSHNIIKTKDKASKSQIMRLVIEDIARAKGIVKQESIEAFYSSWYDNKIQEARNYLEKLNSNLDGINQY